MTEETYRYWRRLLSSLDKKKGRNADFNMGDVLALKVIKMLTENFGVNIKSLIPIEDKLFETCRTIQLESNNNLWLVIRPTAGLIAVCNKDSVSDVSEAILIVPINELVSDLKGKIMENTMNYCQQTLILNN